MPEVKYHGKGPQERISDRLKNSGGHYPTTPATII
jgi:hypothetical protein